MLIRSVEAENFMKFSKLHLSDLPERGVIGVEGPNESGKSTIGEAILFAFFGRSRMSKGCPLENLIHWGSDFLRVSVEFVLNAGGDSEREGATGEHFVVFREVDRFGTNFVKVLALPKREAVAVGNIEVAEFFASRIKFDFFEFQHAFYHDQYRSRYVDEALREFVERLTGVRQMQTATGSIREEVERLEREFSHFHRDVKRNLKQIERHGAGAARLQGLREESGEAAKRVEEHRQNAQDLERVQDERKKIQRERESVEKRLRAMSVLGVGEFESEVADLVLCHESLERHAQTNGVLRDDLSRDFARVQDGVGRIDELLRDCRELRGVFADSHDSMEADLSESREDSLIRRRLERTSESVSIAARARRQGLGLVVFVILFLFSVGVAFSAALQPGLGALAGLPDAIEPLHLIIGGASFALLALILLILKIVKLTDLKHRREETTKVVEDLDRQISKARDGIEKLDKLRAIEKSATIRDYVHKARGAARETAIKIV